MFFQVVRNVAGNNALSCNKGYPFQKMGIQIDFLGSKDGLQTFVYNGDAKMNICFSRMDQQEIAYLLSTECFVKSVIIKTQV